MSFLEFGFGRRHNGEGGSGGGTGGGGGTGTIAQAVSLLTSGNAAANNVYSFAGGVAPVASATLTASLTAGSSITSLPATVGASTITSPSTLLIVWGGYVQAFTTSSTASSGALSIAINSATPNFSYPSGTVLAVSTLLPYLQFPSTPPQAVTAAASMRFILHNWAFQTPVYPWVLNSDGSLFAGTGGYLCRLEPGARTQSGTTSFGALNQNVTGNPTASMRIAFQNVITTETAGFNIAVNAWMA